MYIIMYFHIAITITLQLFNFAKIKKHTNVMNMYIEYINDIATLLGLSTLRFVASWLAIVYLLKSLIS